MNTNTIKKPFLTIMNDNQAKDPAEVRRELNSLFNKPGGLSCPVPGCQNSKTFTSWGQLFDHFMDDGHKRDYFNVYQRKYHRPFGKNYGPEFKFGVMALLLSVIQKPTTPATALATGPTKKTKQTAVIGKHTVVLRSNQEKEVISPFLFPKEEAIEEDPEEEDSGEEETIGEITQMNKNRMSAAFANLSNYIRNTKEISVVWRGKVMDSYIDIFHGNPPCLHCLRAEGKQIHHQSPLFHQIVLFALNKLGTTAEKVLDASAQKNETPRQQVLKEVFDYHMKKGFVLAAPYCHRCNQDAEAQRQAGKTKKKKG